MDDTARLAKVRAYVEDQRSYFRSLPASPPAWIGWVSHLIQDPAETHESAEAALRPYLDRVNDAFDAIEHTALTDEMLYLQETLQDALRESLRLLGVPGSMDGRW